MRRSPGASIAAIGSPGERTALAGALARPTLTPVRVGIHLPQYGRTASPEAVERAARHAETVQRFTTLGIDPVGNTPAEYAAQIKIDIEKYAKAVKISGARAD